MKVFTISLIFVFCLLVLTVSGQSQTEKTPVCTNKAIETISSRGIKIGLKIDDVLNQFDLTEDEKQGILSGKIGKVVLESGIPKETFGFKLFRIQPKPNDEKFDGISAYNFSFLDGRLVEFYVNYNKPQWKNINQFGNTLIRFFDLPKIENWEGNSAILKLQCENYQINLRASNDSNGSFSISDNRIEQILKEREQKFKKEQREKDIKAFKP